MTGKKMTVTAMAMMAGILPSCSSSADEMADSQNASCSLPNLVQVYENRMMESILDRPLIGWRSNHGITCLPGKGEFQLSEEAISDVFGDHDHIDVKTWRVSRSGDEWYGYAMAELRTESSGLVPEKRKTVLATIDLDTMKSTKTVTSSETFDKAVASDDKTIILIGEGEEEKDLAGREPSHIVGYDMNTGEKRWEMTARVDPKSISDHISHNITTFPAMLDTDNYNPLRSERSSSPSATNYNEHCEEVAGIDMSTGEKMWLFDSSDPSLFDQEGGCWNMKFMNLNGPSYTKITARSRGDDTQKTILMNLRNDSEVPDDLIQLEGVSSLPEEYRDPKSVLSVLLDKPNSMAGNEGSLIVIDRKKQERVFELPRATLDKLGVGLEIHSLFDKKLYLSNSDGKSVVSAVDGKKIGGEWDKFPIGSVNGYTIFDDGSTVKE